MTGAEWQASCDPAAMGGAVAELPRATPRVLRLCLAAFWNWQSYRLKSKGGGRLRRRAIMLADWAETNVEPQLSGEDVGFVGFATDPADGLLSTVFALRNWNDAEAAAQHAVWLLRELFGNPFVTRRKRRTDPRRGWMFDPSWRTDTAVSLAKQMYESRDFSLMPILADALQDAGCDNEDILSHCREPGVHVRGCWVLDLVLGKE